MVTFEQARTAVKKDWPDYDIAPSGYQSDTEWFVLLLPETVGCRIAAVSKSKGEIRWTNEADLEYTQENPAG